MTKASKPKTRREQVPDIDFSGGVRGKYAKRYARVTTQQADELDRRLAEHDSNPAEGAMWDEIRDRLGKKMTGC